MIELLKILCLFMGLISTPRLLWNIIHSDGSRETFISILVWSISWTVVLYFYFFSFL